MIDVEQAHYSRFQVLCAERPAWARPVLRRETDFYYDGQRFWARTQGRDRLRPSWRAPRYGWVHEPGCDCGLCARRGEKAPARLLAG